MSVLMFSARGPGERAYTHRLGAKMMLKTKWFLASTLAAAFLGAQAHGSVIVLQGGDPGEGFSPLPTTIAAVDLSGGNNIDTVQGVTFKTSDTHITTGATSPFPGTSFVPGGSA